MFFPIFSGVVCLGPNPSFSRCGVVMVSVHVAFHIIISWKRGRERKKEKET